MIEQLQSVDGAATRSVAVGDGRRITPAPGPVVTGNGAEVSFLGAGAAGIEHRHHGLVSALHTAGLWPDLRAVVLCRPDANSPGAGGSESGETILF
jgi:hypothetical protein